METKEKHLLFMRRAIELSRASMEGGGGPSGAVIVRDGKIIGEGSNGVTIKCDPTAHAEVEAIRQAARATASYDLGGAVIYTSCEPCPMCLGAIYWARLDKIYYANDRTDAARAGFDDSFIYDEIDIAPSDRRIPSVRVEATEAIGVFREWTAKEDKTEY